MLYAIIASDVPDSLSLRQQVRAAHLARVEALRDEGRLILAGPFPAVDASDPGTAGFSGSLIVAEFPELADAERWIQEDPYATSGVFDRITVKPFRMVLP